MIPFSGKDNFGERFDFYKWSAPFFETPQEVVGYIDSLALYGKTLQRINVIGCGCDVGHTNSGLLYRKITEAGVEPENDWYDNYAHLDKVMLPWSVRLCEPIQFIFEDGITLEILPTEDGGARVGVNTIPQNISHGLNDSNFDADTFFAEAIGRTFESFSMRVIETNKQYVDTYSLEREKPHIETRHEYLFRISLGYPYEMTLLQTWESWYRAEMAGSGWLGDMIPYDRVKASVKETTQARIINGRDGGGTFWIVPTHLTEKEIQSRWLDCFGISIDDYVVCELLGVFLVRYFDPAIQERYEYEANEFDDYGVNLYTFESMRKIIDDIREVCRLLVCDYDNPILDEIKEHFPCYPYTNKHKDELTKQEINRLRKNHVGNAVDFYERFCTRVEHMMTLPGYNAISFAGP